MSRNSLKYISNAGVMLQIGGRKILFDPLTIPENEIYKDTDPLAREGLLASTPPYDGVDLVLITHHHRDHFHAESVLALLKQQPGASLVSTGEVIRRIKALDEEDQISESRLYAPELGMYEQVEITVNGIRLRLSRTLHDGEDYAEVENLMIMVEGDLRIAHLGDSAPVEKNFEGLQGCFGGPIDLLIANFPYVALPKARKLIQTCLDPRLLAVVHFPDPEKPAASWTVVAKKSFDRVKANYLPTVLLERLGETIALPSKK